MPIYGITSKERIIIVMLFMELFSQFVQMFGFDSVLVQEFGVNIEVVKLPWVCSEFMMTLCVVVRVDDVFLDDVEAHLEDIVCFVFISETFFLFMCVNVTQFLRSLRMFYAHLILEVLKYYNSYILN